VASLSIRFSIPSGHEVFPFGLFADPEAKSSFRVLLAKLFTFYSALKLLFQSFPPPHHTSQERLPSSLSAVYFGNLFLFIFSSSAPLLAATVVFPD